MYFFKLANHLHSVFVKHMPHQAIKTTIIKNNVRAGKSFCSVSFFFQFFYFPCLYLCMYVYLFLSRVCLFLCLSVSLLQSVYDSFVIQFLQLFSMNISLNLTSRGGLVHLWVNFIIQQIIAFCKWWFKSRLRRAYLYGTIMDPL